jgi:hypothetical protein
MSEKLFMQGGNIVFQLLILYAGRTMSPCSETRHRTEAVTLDTLIEALKPFITRLS